MTITKERVERFRRIVEDLEGKNKTVFTQVDPDAIGAASGLVFIFGKLGKDAEILFGGAVSHQQNRAILNRFSLLKSMQPIREVEINPEDNFMLVDSALGKDNRVPGLDIQPVIVIDHHRGSDLPKEGEGQFFWIEDIGSACTLIVELIQALELELTEEDKNLATLLALGIYTDTKKLDTASQRDREAYTFATRHASEEDLRKLNNYPRSKRERKQRLIMLGRLEEKGPYMITDIGTIPKNQGDHLSTFSDELIVEEGITFVLVWAIIKNPDEDEDDTIIRVHISARNDNLSTPLDELLEGCFGEASGAKLTPDLKGEGGATMFIEKGPLLLHGTEEMTEQLVRDLITKTVFAALDVDEPEED